MEHTKYKCFLRFHFFFVNVFTGAKHFFVHFFCFKPLELIKNMVTNINGSLNYNGFNEIKKKQKPMTLINGMSSRHLALISLVEWRRWR